MKTHLTAIITISMLSVIMISGCTSTNHFEDQSISFNYPANWKTGVIYDLPGAVVGVSENSQVDVKIFKKNITPDSSLEKMYNKTKANRNANYSIYCFQQLSEERITLDGQPAYENIYQLGCNSTQTRQMVREVWLEKNGYIYVITCTVIPPEIYSNKSNDFDIIINSFHVK